MANLGLILAAGHAARHCHGRRGHRAVRGSVALWRHRLRRPPIAAAAGEIIPEIALENLLRAQMAANQ